MSQLRVILAGGTVRELREAARIAQEAGAQVRLADHAGEALAFARTQGADLILADIGCDVPALLVQLRRERIAVPVLACGVDAPATAAVAAVRAGAIDFLPLPPSRELIAAALLSIGHRPVALVGSDPAWRNAVATAERLAATRLPLLIAGAPGTGKQLLARRVHALSGRTGPFVTVDALEKHDGPALRSELFGHRAGDFDGAFADRLGKLGEADGGTLLVRRAEALGGELQDMLLPLLGARKARLIVTAGNREALRPMLAEALAPSEIRLLPLRERRGDILLLAKHFAAEAARSERMPVPAFDEGAVQALHEHDWPGNVPELQQVVQRAVLTSAAGAIDRADLPLGSAKPNGELSIAGLVGRSMEEVERALILGTLERCGGNRTSASAILGISVRTMRNKLKAFQGEGYPVVPAA